MTSHEIIGSDGALTAAQRATLRVVLDMIIPASEDGRFPSAADIDVLDHIRESGSQLLPALREDLGRLDRLAAERSGSAFARLTESGRSRTVSGTSKKDYPNGEQESSPQSLLPAFEPRGDARACSIRPVRTQEARRRGALVQTFSLELAADCALRTRALRIRI